MEHNGSMNSPLVAGLAIAAGIGVALWLNRREDRGESRAVARLASGAVGGGLLLYGMNASGKLSRLAATAGGTLLVRSLKDEPIRHWTEIINPAKMFSKA